LQSLLALMPVYEGVFVGLLRILCSSVFACALVLLLVSCGTNPATSTTTSNSSASGLTASPQANGAAASPQANGAGTNPQANGAGTSPKPNGAGTSPKPNGAGASPQTEGAGTSPQTEGTGPESPQSPGNGGVSVPLAGLPIGDGGQVGDNQGNNECVGVAWLGQISSPGVVLTVTGVSVTGQPPAQFTTVDPAAAGCPQDHPSCVGSKLTMADNDGKECYAGVQYTGPSLSDTSPSADGTLQLDGSLSCQNVDSATCEKYLQAGQGAPSVGISFTATSTTDGGSTPSDSSSL
jgi:hypothetical protein